MTTIVIVSMVGNVWSVFYFHKSESGACDLYKNLAQNYFHMTLAYTCIIMLIPILIIFASNSIIIASLYKKNQRITKKQITLKSKKVKSTIECIKKLMV